MNPPDRPAPIGWGQVDGYHQDYIRDLSEKQRVYAFCRECRRGFKADIKPAPDAKVRCMCGNAGLLRQFDVFSSIERARDFGRFYIQLVQEVKNVLRSQDVPIPESGRLPQQPLGEPPDHPHVALIIELRAEVHAAADIVARHDALSKLIALGFEARHISQEARKACEVACREDIDLAPELIREAKRRKKLGNPLRISFTSFKHLALLLEDEGDFPSAIAIAERAMSLGLKGYTERIEELRLASGELGLESTSGGSHGG